MPLTCLASTQKWHLLLLPMILWPELVITPLIKYLSANSLLLMKTQFPPHGDNSKFYLNEAGCSQEEGPKKGFVMGSRAQGVQEILEKCV